MLATNPAERSIEGDEKRGSNDRDEERKTRFGAIKNGKKKKEKSIRLRPDRSKVKSR